MIYIQNVSDETYLKDGISEDVVGKIISKWPYQKDEVVDFGGGEKDVSCATFMRLTGGKLSEVKAKFGLTDQEAKGVIAFCRDNI